MTGGGARELAGRLGISEPTVTHWCRRTALPPPRRLQAWLRVLLAAQLLDDSGRSVKSVSLACGYLAEKSLRRVMRRFVGLDTRMLRKRGAFETSILAFNQELRTLREQRRSGRQAASRVVVPMAADDVTVPAREAPRAGDAAGLLSLKV
ncbi:MAG TPA: helix-turn-helix domain-containing protein [Longimicrobium sp.]|nr:helix-turn-helix domain-containing protein [Longimicrobium sp.]